MKNRMPASTSKPVPPPEVTEIVLSPERQKFFRDRTTAIEMLQTQVNSVLTFLVEEAGGSGNWELSADRTKIVKK